MGILDFGNLGLMYKNVLLAYDGSVEGARALREGALLAKTCGAKVTLLSVVPDTSGGAEALEGIGGAAGQQIDDYKGLLRQAVAWLEERGIKTDARVAIGEPAQAIGTLAKEVDADLVVVGRHRQSFFSRWWSGTTQAYLSDHVTCSILIACNPTDTNAFETDTQDSVSA